MKTKNKKNPIDTLNTRELAVVRYLVKANSRGDSPGRGLHDIATGCFDRKTGTSVKASSAFRANSWARNAVRRPLRERLIRRVGPPGSGVYCLAALGEQLTKRGGK